MIWLAKLESEELPYEAEWVRSDELLKDVESRMIPLAEQEQVQFDVVERSHFEMRVDREKFLQAISNIVVNAIRHARSRVSVYVKGTEIVIEDDGNGIPEDLIPHIFNRFVKGKGGETGLGLAIARTIIEQSQGQIKVEQSSLGGARFVIEFPWKES
ncbi:sensor histidine kinase [Piscibacillus salipiscarius]